MRHILYRTRALVQALALGATLALQAAAYAQSAPDMDEVLVENRWTKVTRGDYEAELQRLPAEIRGGFAFSGKRVSDLLVRLLVTKSLAVQARASDVYKDADARRRRARESFISSAATGTASRSRSRLHTSCSTPRNDRRTKR